MSNVTSTVRPLLSGDLLGNAKFVDVQTVTTPGTLQTLWSETVPVNHVYNLIILDVVCRQEGSYTLSMAGAVIASGRTGPGQANIKFSWYPFRQAIAGQLIELKFLGMAGKPIVGVEAYLQARDITL